MLSQYNKKSHDKAKLETFLANLGLDETDQKAYLTTLSLADATASEIIIKAGINRSHGYKVLDKLATMGIVSNYQSKGKVRYFAENPKKIKLLLEEQLSTFNNRLFLLLNEYIEKNVEVPEVREFKGVMGAKQIFEEALTTKEKLIYTMGSASDLKLLFGVNSAYTEKRVSLGIQSYSLRNKESEWNPEHITNQKQNLKQVRWIPKDLLWNGYVIIWDDWCGIIDTVSSSPTHILMKNTFAKNMKQLFLWLWDQGEKIS